MKKLIIISVLGLLLGACTASQVAKTQESTSVFDGSKTLASRPMTSFGADKWHSSGIFFGARWNNTYPDVFILEVKALDDSYKDIRILQLNIDGKLIEAKPSNYDTHFEKHGIFESSTKRFAIKTSDAESIMRSSNTKFRVVTSDGVIDGAITLNGSKSQAYRSIENTINAIKN